MRTAWVTGASGAWGGAFVRALLANGYDITALGRHDVPELARRAAELGRGWTFLPFDLDRPLTLAEPIGPARAPDRVDPFDPVEPAATLREGAPDVLIHAAVSTTGDRAELTARDYLAPAALVERVARAMLDRGAGRIGVLVPQNARLGLAGLGDVSAAQAALWTWCEARRDELARDPGDVSLTVVIPPRTASETQRFVAERSGHRARLSPPDATALLRAVLAGKRRAGRRPYLAALAMLFR